MYKGQKNRNDSSSPHRGCCKLPWLPKMVLGWKLYQMPFSSIVSLIGWFWGDFCIWWYTSNKFEDHWPREVLLGVHRGRCIRANGAQNGSAVASAQNCIILQKAVKNALFWGICSLDMVFFQVIFAFGGRSETCTKVSNLQGSCQGPTGTAAWAQNCPQWQFKVCIMPYL